MYYKLSDDFALRAWKFVPHGLYNRYLPGPVRIGADTFDLLLKCDGEHDLEESEELDRLAKTGIIIPCGKGDAPSEWSRFRKYGHRFVPAINLMITGKCNYNCRHCFNAADNADKMKEWDWDDLMDLFDQAADCGVHSITLTGGEPMIYPRFLDAVREIYRRGMTLEKLTTNGYFLTKEVLDEFKRLKCAPVIKISFDGVGCHDWMRGHKGAEERTIDAFRLCAEEGFKTLSQTQVNRKNVDSIEETLDLLDSIGVTTTRLIRTTAVPRWIKNAPDASLPVSEYFERTLDLADRYMRGDHRMDVLVWQFIHVYPEKKFFRMEDVISHDGRASPTRAVCVGNRTMMGITCEGYVVPCLQMAGYAMELGYECDSLKERRLRDVIESGKWHDAVCMNHHALGKRSRECGKCEWFGYCGGGCRALGMLDSVEREGAIDEYAADPVACLFFKGGWYDRVRERLKDFSYPGHILSEPADTEL